MKTNDRIIRDNEAAERFMKTINNRIPMRMPAEEDLQKIPFIQTDTNKENLNEQRRKA
jgi:hypothetical protein